MTTKKILKISIFILTAGFFAFGLNSLAQASCPANTEVLSETSVNLVGEVTNDGGDPNLTVWFQYGKTISYGSETPQQSKYGLGSFCSTVYNLTPCTLYNYRAAARNSGGTSYGANYTFTTKCLPTTVDIKANGSDGPITLQYQDYVTLSWTSQNANSCTASGDWSGSKSTSGSQSIQLNQVKTYVFTITCYDLGLTKSGTDSVQVIVRAKPPIVITKPAVVTY